MLSMRLSVVLVLFGAGSSTRLLEDVGGSLSSDSGGVESTSHNSSEAPKKGDLAKSRRPEAQNPGGSASKKWIERSVSRRC